MTDNNIMISLDGPELFVPTGRIIVVANGKGGVGKSSVAVNLAACMAARGARVLLVDLDKQSDCARSLGIHQHDAGAGLLSAIYGGAAVPIASGRPNLDVLPSGVETRDLETILADRARRSLSELLVLRRVVQSLAASYDLVVIDTPPGMEVLLDAALIAGDWLVIPTRADDSSLEGLVRIGDRFVRVTEAGVSNIRVAGVVLFDISTSAVAIRSDVREGLTQSLAGSAPVFESVIRHSEKAAVDQRRLGVVAIEYAGLAASADPWYLRRGGPRYARTASSLADDYESLVDEVLDRVLLVEITV